MISDSGWCLLVTGGLPSRCFKYVYSDSICESLCTSLESCIGYSYSIKYIECYLYPFDESCPYGFTYISEANKAYTINDLVAGKPLPVWVADSTYDCYGRVLGKYN